MAEGRNLVGVDIGASSIKVIQLKEAKGQLSVVRFGYTPLPAQSIIDGHVMNAGAVTEALQKTFRDNKISQKDVAIGVYGQSVIVRKITVPIMTPEELDEQINWEAEQHIPFDIKLMTIDYEVIKKRPEAGQMDLLLVAAKTDEVRDYANILKEANLRPAVVDINAFTVQNIFENRIGFTDDTTVALLNVGAAVTTLNVVSRGASCFTREIANAGNTITEEVRRRCNVSSEQAELFKCVGPEGGAPEEALGAIMHASGTLAGEIQRSIDFFIATNGEQELSKICICGGSAYLEPLARAIEERSRVPVELFDPLVNVAVDAKHVNEQELRSRSAQLVVAMGLALRRDRENRQWSA